MASLLEELATAGRTTARTVGRSVVGLGRRATGVVVRPGVVATNAHNLRHEEVTVTFDDGSTAVGTVQAADVDGDVALVRVDTGDRPAVAWSDAVPQPGAPVFALANPGGRGTRMSFGIVSATDRGFRGPRGRRISGALEHTAPLLRGSSGGPVVDLDGKVVGLNTHRLGEGFYLALPADESLRATLDRLAAGETPVRRSLGIAVAPPEVARRLRSAVGLAERDGLLVRAVDPDGPAARAGVREGDLLVAAGSVDLDSVDRLHHVLDGWTEDDLPLTVVRGADELTLTVGFDGDERDTTDER